MKLSRREWTRLLGQGVGAWVGCWMYGHFSPAIVRAATAEALSYAPSAGSLGKQVRGVVDELLERILNDPERRESYGELGAACLRSFGGPGGREQQGEDPGELRDRLRTEIDRSLELEAPTSGASNTIDRFRRAIRRDFAEERTLEVSGWLLSRTEASFYALVALRLRSSAP